MDRPMPIALFAAFALALLLFGCATAKDRGGAEDGNAAAAQYANGTGFLVPDSAADYTAHYIVNDGGQETGKIVYRMGRNFRLDYQNGNMTVSVFLLGSRAYSCARMLSGEYGCFDITAKAASQGVPALIGTPDLEGASEDEVVDVGAGGQMKAQCYLFANPPLQSRKACFTSQGIMAYDEYPIPGGQKHIEYLANLKLSANLRDFGLPSTPAAPPEDAAVEYGG